MHKLVAVLGFAVIVATAPQAYALGGGGGHRGAGGSVSGIASGGNVSGNFNGGSFQGTYGNGSFSGRYTLAAPEPLAALAVGLGLVGARLLRRRR